MAYDTVGGTKSGHSREVEAALLARAAVLSEM